MDFQKAKRPLEDSVVYILTENDFYSTEILAVFATLEAAEMAKAAYEARMNRKFRAYYDIFSKEILDTTERKGQGPETSTMGEGPDPNVVPSTGT
jgi:hypothetical protein